MAAELKNFSAARRKSPPITKRRSSDALFYTIKRNLSMVFSKKEKTVSKKRKKAFQTKNLTKRKRNGRMKSTIAETDKRERKNA